MIEKSTTEFLSDLKGHNNREWMETHRERYLAAKQNFEDFGNALIKKLGETDPAIAHLQARDCVFRLNRDVRFSKNKDPYKTNMGLYLSRGGKKSPDAGYYFHLDPEGSFAAGGMWMPLPEQLKKIRQEIDYNFPAFKKMVESAAVKKQFGGLSSMDGAKLSRPPKGYDDGNPAIEYLKYKSFIFSAPLTAEEVADPKFVSRLAAVYTKLKPLVDFLNVAGE